MILPVLGSVALAYASDVLPKAGPRQLIRGGSQAAVSDWPFLVRIDAFGQTCTGVLLSAYHVLTARHCVYVDEIKSVLRTYQNRIDKAKTTDKTTYRITLADNKQVVFEEKVLDTAWVRAPEQPSELDMATSRDVAVIILRDRVEWSRDVQPIEELEETHFAKLPRGTMLNIAGYGAEEQADVVYHSWTGEYLRGGQRLHPDKPKTLSNIYFMRERNEQTPVYAWNKLKEKLIVVFNKSDQPCAGDSGSPLVYYDKNAGGQPKLVGIFTRGPPCFDDSGNTLDTTGSSLMFGISVHSQKEWLLALRNESTKCREIAINEACTTMAADKCTALRPLVCNECGVEETWSFERQRCEGACKCQGGKVNECETTKAVCEVKFNAACDEVSDYKSRSNELKLSTKACPYAGYTLDVNREQVETCIVNATALCANVTLTFTPSETIDPESILYVAVPANRIDSYSKLPAGNPSDSGQPVKVSDSAFKVTCTSRLGGRDSLITKPIEPIETIWKDIVKGRQLVGRNSVLEIKGGCPEGQEMTVTVNNVIVENTGKGMFWWFGTKGTREFGITDPGLEFAYGDYSRFVNIDFSPKFKENSVN